jgi:predicted ATPase with chaperone activity
MNASAQVWPERKTIAMPKAPRTIAETGLTEGFLVDLMLKIVFRQGLELPSQIAGELRLSLRLVEQLVELAKEKQLLFLLGQPGANMAAEMRYQLTDKGRQWAEQALAQNSWTGAAPVPIEQFNAQTIAQSVKQEQLSESALKQIFTDLILPDSLLNLVGPAVNSGQSILLYGPPGNGKSSISDAMKTAFQHLVYLPHAIIIGQEIVVFYDTAIHEPVQMGQHGDGGLRRQVIADPRYVLCTRPHVVVGGELTLEKFDLVRNPASGLYDAPLQLKAAGGILVVDDFGRQKQSPQALINRLIIPLEASLDHLVLETGRKIEVPFDTLVLFATNYEPRSLMDEAGLRRLRHKILVDRPDRRSFVKIFLRAAERQGMDVGEDIMAFLLFDLYGTHPNVRFNAFHGRFLIDQSKAICQYRGVEPQLTPEILTQAWQNLIASH